MGWWQRLLGIEPVEQRQSNTFGSVESAVLASLDGLRSTSAGVSVSEEGALRHTAVLACVRILSNSVAMLPLPVYRRLSPRGKQRVPEHPLYPLLHEQANPEMSAFELRRWLMQGVMLWGNGYAEIAWSDAGTVTALWPLRPDKVEVERRGGALVYRCTLPTGGVIWLPQWKVLHLRGLSGNGVTGYSVVRQLINESVGLGLATQEFGARFFGNGARPGVVLKHPGTLSDKAYANLRAGWAGEHEGLSNAHRVRILEEGMDVTPLGIPPEEAQFLECVAADTLVTMADGTRRRAQELRAGDAVLAWRDGLHVARIAAVGKPPMKELVRVVTARGRALTTTADHPYLVKLRLRTLGGRPDVSPPDWVNAADLEPGHYVRVALGYPGGVRWETVAPDTAWLLGFLVGNGYIRKGGCSLSTAEPAVVAQADMALGSLGGSLRASNSRPYDYQILTGGGARTGRRGSMVRSLLNDAGLVGKRAADKRVPEMVLRGGPPAWTAFLAGYFDADGTVQGADAAGQPLVAWSSVSRELLEECQHMLAMLGINSGIYLHSESRPHRVMGMICQAQAQWGLYVTGASQLRRLAAEMTPHYPKKRTRLASLAHLPESCYRAANWEYDRVVKVTRLGPGETVGIEVEGAHTHVTGGLVTHNTRKFQVTEIARAFGVPPHLIGDMERATFSNIEHQYMEFLQFSLGPYLRQIEQVIHASLMTPAERRVYFVEHVRDSILQADTMTRFQAHALGRQWGWLSVNDIRALENMNPVAGGDEYLVPLNMTPAGTLQQPNARAQGTAEGRKEQQRQEPSAEPSGVYAHLNGYRPGKETDGEAVL